MVIGWLVSAPAKSGFVRMRPAFAVRRLSAAVQRQMTDDESFGEIASWPAAFIAAKPRSRRPCGRRAVAPIGELTAVGAQVLGGRSEHGGTVKDGPVGEPLQGLGVATGRDRPGFEFLRLGRAVARKTHALAPAKTLCCSHNRCENTAGRRGRGRLSYSQGTEVGSQPLDPARQSFCDAAQLPVAAR